MIGRKFDKPKKDRRSVRCLVSRCGLATMEAIDKKDETINHKALARVQEKDGVFLLTK